MAYQGHHDYSTDTEDETVQLLRTHGISNDSIRNFKATTKRLSKRVRRDNGDKTSADFCIKCGCITIEGLRVGVNIADSFHVLKQSAQNCKLCRLVLTSLRNKLPDIDAKLETGDEWKSDFKATFKDDGATDTNIGPVNFVNISRGNLLETFRLSMSQEMDGYIRVEARISLKMTGRERRQGLFCINSLIRIYTKNESIGQFHRLPLDTRPRSDRKFELIIQWLQQEKLSAAEMSFMLASPAVRAERFPSRLIQLSSCSQSTEFQLQLVNSADLLKDENVREGMPYPPYITLSHRWGTKHTFTTTKASLSSRQKGFSLCELPKTYIDAVIVAQQLGFSYIWIDAICIVQDDDEEWTRESQRMGMIYRHAAFTIANHCSDNDDSGFLTAALQKRGSVDMTPCGLRRIYLRSAADLEYDITRSPLSKRGWVLQERFLSTRILHFTTGMIYFETAQGIRSEDGECLTGLMGLTVDSLNLLTVEHFMYRKPLTLQNFSVCLPQPAAHMPSFINSQNVPETSLGWFSLLEMYSTCSLTREQDKLTAIFGIATVCRQSTRASYLAGFWSDRLVIGLMWINVGNQLKSAKLVRAASWSWALYDGPIQFPLARCDPQEYTTKCQLVSHEGSNATWLNGPGALTLKVQLLKLYPVMIDGGLLISLYREELYPVKSRAWDLGDDDSLGQTDSMRLFNIFNARRLLWVADHNHNGDGSWVVLENEEGLLGRQKQCVHKLHCASLATFQMFCRINKRFIRAHMVILLVEVEIGPIVKYRRVGAGLLKESFVEGVREFGAARGQSLVFEDQEITLI